MRRFTCCVIVFHCLFLGIPASSAKSQAVNTVDTGIAGRGEVGEKLSASSKSSQSETLNARNFQKLGLPREQVWVIDGKQQAQRQSFMWVVKDTKKAEQQPFLQVQNIVDKPAKPDEKTDVTPKPAK